MTSSTRTAATANSDCATGSAMTAPNVCSRLPASRQASAAAGAAAAPTSRPGRISRRRPAARITSRGWGTRAASTEYQSSTTPGNRMG